MRFASPGFLYLLVLVPLLAAGLLVSARRRRRLLDRFAAGAGHASRFLGDVSPHVRVAKALLLLVAVAAGIVAAARPQWGTRLETVNRKGLDVVIAVDTSQSMAARDVAPDRLGLARHAAASLVDRLGGDRIALVTFAGEASLACPLTLDQEAVKILLDALDVEVVPVAGTALGDALRVAMQAFGPAAPGGATRGRALVLFTDGEDHEGGVEEMARSLENTGVSLYAVGCGTQRGAPIPVASADGASEYKKDSENRIVTTRLDESLLERLALATGGNYFRATPAEVEIEEIAEAISGLEATEAGTVLKTRYEERYQIPLAIALIALAGEMLIADRRRRAPAVAAGGGR
jgi:Ca-activated chloride channel family protein